MRDFRDAKAMARTLRDALKAKTVETSHSECLELIAKVFGYDNWNILAAKVEAARSGALDTAVVSTGGTIVAEASNTLHCSFCGKSQHQVRKLIAGPTVFICDECVGLCNGIIEDEKVFDFFAGDDEAAALPGASGKPAEELVSEVLRGKKYTERWRLGLAQVRRELSVRDGEVPGEDNIHSLPDFAFLKNKTRDELLALQQRYERAVKRYEDAQRVAVTVLGEGGQ